MTDYGDPYTNVLMGLWDLLERKSTFTGLVPDSNRIKLNWGPTNARKPQKDALTESDVPEVMIYPGPTRFFEDRDSSGASVHKIYAILVSTGNRLVNDLDNGAFLPLQWAITRAMFDFDTLMDLEWTDPDVGTPIKFVKKVEVPSLEEGLDDAELNRTLKGWTAVWQADVMMWFSNQVYKGG